MTDEEIVKELRGALSLPTKMQVVRKYQVSKTKALHLRARASGRTVSQRARSREVSPQVTENRIKALALKLHRGSELPSAADLALKWDVPYKRASWMRTKARQRAEKIAQENKVFRKVLTKDERQEYAAIIRGENLDLSQVVERWDVSKPQAEYLIRLSEGL